MKNSISQMLLHAQNSYSDYKVHYMSVCKGMPAQKIHDLCVMAAVASKIIEMSETIKTGDIFRAIEEIEFSGKLTAKGLRKLSYGSFAIKLHRWRMQINSGKKITDIICISRQGNDNAAKYRGEELEKGAELLAQMYRLRFSGKPLNNEAIIRLLLDHCDMVEIERPSEYWFKARLADGHVKYLASVSQYDKGNRYRQIYEGVFHGLRMPMANDRWECDGTRINLIATKDEKGKYQSLYGTFVRDNASGRVIGWSFGKAESRYSYVEALEMAVKTTGTLPMELVFDRFPGHESSEVKAIFSKIENFGAKVKIVHRSEGKQGIERWVSTFQSVFLSSSDFYYGQGVKSSVKNAHATTQWVKAAEKKMKQLGWGLEQLAAETEKYIGYYNETKITSYGKKKNKLPYSPIELYQRSPRANEIKMCPWQIADMFWLERQVTMRQRQVFLTINHQDCSYPIEDIEMLKTLNRKPKVTVKYNEYDLDEIFIFDIDTQALIGTLKRRNIGQNIGQNADTKAIGHYKSVQKKQNEEAEKERTELTQAANLDYKIHYWGKQREEEEEEQKNIYTEVDGLLQYYNN